VVYDAVRDGDARGRGRRVVTGEGRYDPKQYFAVQRARATHRYGCDLSERRLLSDVLNRRLHYLHIPGVGLVQVVMRFDPLASPGIAGASAEPPVAPVWGNDHWRIRIEDTTTLLRSRDTTPFPAEGR
jgi:hypothetical protein